MTISFSSFGFLENEEKNGFHFIQTIYAMKAVLFDDYDNNNNNNNNNC